MGIPEDEIHEITGAWPKADIEKKFLEINARVMAYTLEEKRTFVFIYAVGHGIINGEQFYMLNSVKDNKFNLEAYARSISNSQSCCFTLCLYDLSYHKTPHQDSRGGGLSPIRATTDPGCNYHAITK